MLHSTRAAGAKLLQVCHEDIAVIRFAFAPPRHPLARFGLGLAGLITLALLSVFGLALAALVATAVAGRAIWLRLAHGTPTGKGAVDPLVIDGEFKVVDAPRLSTHR
ncbi:MAG: hypothetical protein ACT4NL_07360 [Pseudomarimonas sp.]